MQSSHWPNEEQHKDRPLDGPASAQAVERSHVVLLTAVGVAQPILHRALLDGRLTRAESGAIERCLARLDTTDGASGLRELLAAALAPRDVLCSVVTAVGQRPAGDPWTAGARQPCSARVAETACA